MSASVGTFQNSDPFLAKHPSEGSDSDHTQRHVLRYFRTNGTWDDLIKFSEEEGDACMAVLNIEKTARGSDM